MKSIFKYANAVTRLFSLLLAAGCAGKEHTASTTPGASQSVADAKFGVLVMAHGGPPEWNDAVEQTVAPLRGKYQIEVAFGMADAASLQEAVRKFEARDVHRIGVVRLFISGESWFEVLEGLDYVSDGRGLIPHDEVGAWIERQIVDLAKRA